MGKMVKKGEKGNDQCQGLERVKGIEPSYEAWEAAVLPLNYTRLALAAGLRKDR